MNEIKNRYLTLLWQEATPEVEILEQWEAALLPASEGLSWQDIDYADQTRSEWNTERHLFRLRNMIIGFGKERLEDPTYRERMVGALNYWLVHAFENPNWWWNEIGVPHHIGDIALMLQPYLNKEQLAQAEKLVERGYNAINPRWTGTNLIWGISTCIRLALLQGDEQIFNAAIKRAAQEITTDLPEGIQKDFSYFQHGPLLYSGGYGYKFVDNFSKILFLTNHTRFKLPEKKIDIFLSYLLEGLRYMIHQGRLDWNCIGRNISRIGWGDTADLAASIELLISIDDFPRTDKLKEFLAELRGSAQRNQTKYFPIAAMLCHRFDGIYVGAKFLNNKIFGAEHCNDEGILCYNMSYGTHTCIMRTGAEYFNINPIWDYSRVPGTTSYIESDEQLLRGGTWKKSTLPNDCFGGDQKGARAIIYELAEHDGIRVLVTDFAFENGFICLGAALCAESAEKNLVTTVDQCFAAESPQIDRNHLIHNAIRYTALQPSAFQVEVKEQKGNWKRNNLALSDQEVSASVLTISIPHIKRENGGYAYMISSAAQGAPLVEVLRNDEAVQAIRLPDGSIMAVFHQAAELWTDHRKLCGEAGRIYIE